MSVLIKGVIEKTPAYKKFKENDILLQINGHDIKDVLEEIVSNPKILDEKRERND